MIIITNKETNRVEGWHTSSPEFEARYANNNPTMNTLSVDDGFTFTEDITLYEVVNGQVQLIADWETENAAMVARDEAEQQQTEVDMLKARLAELGG
jgi:hypothetical protein